MCIRDREYTLDGSKPVGAFDGGIKLTRTNSKTGCLLYTSRCV